MSNTLKWICSIGIAIIVALLCVILTLVALAYPTMAETVVNTTLMISGIGIIAFIVKDVFFK